MKESSNHSRAVTKRPPGRYRYVRLRWRVLFTVIDLLGAAVFGFARALRRRLQVKCFPNVAVSLRETQPHLAERDGYIGADPRVILLVQLDHLGDAIISTAMLPALRERFPDASIEVLASPWNREVFEAAPEVDRVYVSHVNRFARGRLRRFAWVPATLWWGWKLRRCGIDLGVDVRGEFPLALILWLCGARRRVGWHCGGGGFLLTDTACYVPDRPEVESRMALLAELVSVAKNREGDAPAEPGVWTTRETVARREPRPPHFHPTDRARQKVARLLAEFSEQHPVAGPLVVLHVGAGSRAKQWPWWHWRELLGRIIVEHGARVVLVGGGSDRSIAQEILDGRPWPGVADWTGRLTVDQLAAVLERADVLVGADSGPAHLAAAVATAVVVLFSGTNHPQQWRPHGEQVTVVRHEVACSPCHRERCPLPDHPCMTRLRPGEVAAEVARTLRTHPPVRVRPEQRGAGILPAWQAGSLPHSRPDPRREGAQP